MTRARIYKPAKTAMQSGARNTRMWLLEYEPEAKKTPDALMGWAGSGDMRSQLRLKFKTQQEAEDYARHMGLDYTVTPPHVERRRLKSYADNFK